MHHTQTTISRRTVLHGVAAVGMTFGLAGCSTPDDGAPSAGASSHPSAAPTTGSVSSSPATVPSSVVVEEHGFTSAGNRIFGQLRRPTGDGRHPVVILSHGFGGNHQQEPHLQDPFTATRYHSLAIVSETLPDELTVSAWTETGVIMAIRHRGLPIEAVQFHPESVLTECGHLLLANWLVACGDATAPERAAGLSPLIAIG